MKKKVLFALIAMFSFLSSWAAEVAVGDYTITVSTQYVALTGTDGVAAPTVTSIERTGASFTFATRCVLDEDGELVEGNIEYPGKYYLVVNFTDGNVKVLKVPFYVAEPSELFDYIKDETSWNASYESGVLKDYYEKYPFEDLWGKPNGSNEVERCATITDRRCDFTSFYDTDTQVATGTVKILQQKWNSTGTEVLWTKVQVISNVLEQGIPYEMEFIDKVYYVAGDPADAVGDGTKLPLFAEATDAGVTTTSVDEHITVTLDYYYVQEDFEQAWEGCINAPGAKLPWICPYYEGEEAMDIVFAYEGKDCVKPWSGPFGENGKKWGIASVAAEFNDDSFVLPTSTFDIDKFSMLLIPANVDLTPTVADAIVLTTTGTDANVAYECDPLPYIGSLQQPTFSGDEDEVNAIVFIPETDAAGQIDLVEGVDYTITYLPEAEDDYINVGTHYFTINFIGDYTGSIENAEYEIEKAHVNLNLAYIYKTYGEADPALPANATDAEIEAYTNKLAFEIDASTPLKGADVKADIAKYLVFKRASGDQNKGEDVKEYEYYYDKTADFEENCNYSVSFLQTKSLLIIQPKAVTINVTPAYKEYHKTVELKYDANALKAQLAEKDKDSASGTPGASDIITSITWEGAGTDAGEAVNADLTGAAPNQTIVFRNQGTGYPFVVEANNNYTVTVATPEEGFAIIPTTTANLTVEVPATEANGAVDGKFVYNGKFQKPDPIVKDGDVLLTKGTDYTVAYEDNQDAGTAAKCKVTLTGSYSSTLNKTENFTIEQAPLVVKPQSTDSEDAYTVLYETFAAREAAADNATTTQETAASEYTRKTDHSYFSVNPTDIKVKKGAEIETDVYQLYIELPTGVTEITAKNYKVTTGTALLALNEKPTLVVRPATNQNKVYDGKEPEEKDLNIAVFKANGSTPATEAEIAALTILGNRVYKITKEEGVDVGTYSLTVSGPTVLKDYNVEYNNAQYFEGRRNYRITHKDVTITPGNYSMVYGHSDELPAMTATVEGLVAPDDATTLGITNPDFYYVGIQNARYDNTTGIWTLNNEAVGTRNINVTVRNLDRGQNYRTVGNYHVRANNPGTLTITKADLIIAADNKTKQFGEADPEFTVTINGAKAGDNVSAYYNLVGRGEETGDKEKVGDHAIVVKKTDAGTNAANYNVSVANGTLTISEATYYVKANDQWINYGGNINPLDVVITLPGREPLRWRKAKINETAEEKKAREDNNAEIEALGSLEVLDGKNAIGANEDAYKWVPVTGGNYTLAADKEVDGEIVKGFTNGYLTVYPLTRIPLDMENLAQVLEDHKGLEGITVVMPAREMVADQWYSWVLPFAVKPSVLFDDENWGYGAAETLDVTKSTGNNVVFGLQVMNPIPANTPFIAKVEEDITADEMKEIEFPVVIADEDADGNEIFYYDYTTGKAVNPTVGTAPNVQFVGLYQDKKGPDETQKFLATTKKTAPQRDFWPGGSKSANFVLVQTEAYLQFNSAVSAANARIFIEDENGTLTEITGVEAGAEVTDGEGWYTITGVKLDAEPTTSGTYIFNGKKVFIQK